MTDFTYIGKRVPKRDALEKVTGSAVYVDDLKFPGMLYCRILRSPYPHARILHVDVSRAERLPGVRAVLTAQDTPGIKIGFGTDNLPLKGDKVRCIGDEVAAVAATDTDTAAEALALIRVEYEELPAVFDPEEAMRPGAPVVHDEKPDNVSLHYHFQAGDPDRALEHSAYVAEDRFRLHFVVPCSMETHGCVARYDGSGNLTVWTSTQIPFLYQKELADALGIPGDRVRVIQPVVGGGFGSRLEMYPFEPVVALLAQRTGRPVKMVYTREEGFVATRPRQPMIIDLKTGIDREGRLTARVARLILDNGAYNAWGATTPMVSMQTMTSLYRVPNSRFDAYVVYTNNPYSSSVRGYGNPQPTFAVESQMDILAEKAGLDPLEFRLLNANRPGDTTSQKMKITTCGLPDCLRLAAEKSGWQEKRGRRRGRGVGVAGYLHVGGGARVYRSDGCGAIVKIDDMGKVTVIAGATDMGQGADTVQALMVAEELQVPLERVQVISQNDTAYSPWDVGAHASRTTFVAGNAVLLAAREAKRQLLGAAAPLLEADPDDLELVNGLVMVKGVPSRHISYDKVVRAHHFRPGGGIIIGHAFYDPPTEMQDRGWLGNVSATYAFGAQAVEVEVDEETGQVRVLSVASAHDVGKVINPLGLEGQVEGGCVMGLGYSLTEQLVVEKGRVQNPALLDYRLFTAADAPAIEVIPVETVDPLGPFGAKGIGETPAIPTAAAVANAVYDAVGVRIRELPLTPERVLRALRAR